MIEDNSGQQEFDLDAIPEEPKVTSEETVEEPTVVDEESRDYTIKIDPAEFQKLMGEARKETGRILSVPGRFAKFIKKYDHVFSPKEGDKIDPIESMEIINELFPEEFQERVAEAYQWDMGESWNFYSAFLVKSGVYSAGRSRTKGPSTS